mmetsp:Transcript_9352/g.12203  ORF Transcript_9352/g.12203 Transcript_9352/m.12203 type:complete len:354 (-) Transcript_9352:261-1322(-)
MAQEYQAQIEDGLGKLCNQLHEQFGVGNQVISDWRGRGSSTKLFLENCPTRHQVLRWLYHRYHFPEQDCASVMRESLVKNVESSLPEVYWSLDLSEIPWQQLQDWAILMGVVEEDTLGHLEGTGPEGTSESCSKKESLGVLLELADCTLAAQEIAKSQQKKHIPDGSSAAWYEESQYLVSRVAEARNDLFSRKVNLLAGFSSLLDAVPTSPDIEHMSNQQKDLDEVEQKLDDAISEFLQKRGNRANEVSMGVNQEEKLPEIQDSSEIPNQLQDLKEELKSLTEILNRFSHTYKTQLKHSAEALTSNLPPLKASLGHLARETLDNYECMERFCKDWEVVLDQDKWLKSEGLITV